MKHFTSGRQRLYLRIYDVDGGVESFLEMGSTRVGSAVRELILPSASASASSPSPKLLSSVRPPPKPPSFFWLHYPRFPDLVVSTLFGRFVSSS
ncbi:hypothetical protein V6N13_114610 [Hibiscus sabdariffa]